MENLELSFDTEPVPVPPAVSLTSVLTGHPFLSALVTSELAKSKPRSGYFRGLAGPEHDVSVKQALLDLAKSFQ